MKQKLLFIASLLLMAGVSFGQVTFADYETQDLNFGGWGGASFAAVTNPDQSGNNLSANCAQANTSTDAWGGLYSDVLAGGTIDFTSGTVFTVNVWAPNAGNVLFKLENATDGGIFTELSLPVDPLNIGKWATMSYDMAGATSGAENDKYSKIVMIFDAGGTTASTWYFDDIVGPGFKAGTGETVTFTVSDYVGLTAPIARVYDDGGTPADYTLYDDGTNGDPLAGDLAWTAVASDLVGGIFNSPAGVGDYTWELVDAGNSVSEMMSFSLGAGEMKGVGLGYYGSGLNNDTVTIMPTLAIPVIDGEIDALWDNFDAVPLTRTSLGAPDNPADLTVSMKAAFGKDHMYFLGMITDNILSINSANEWERDCFELYFDMDEDSVYAGGEGQKRWTYSLDNAGNPGIFAQDSVAGGWNIEIAIPYDAINENFVLAEGVTIGFDISSGDNDSDYRKTVASWHDTQDAAWNTPSVLGKMTFVNVDVVEKPRGGTTVWNPAANPDGDTIESWSDYRNWTDLNVPYMNKVVTNVPGAAEAVIDYEADTINQMVLGDNGDGGVLRVADGGVLTMAAGWSAVGYNDTATLIVETGGEVNFAEHLWIGFTGNGNGAVILNGGTINVPQMTAMGWNGGLGGAIHVNSGMLNLANLHPDNSIQGANSFIRVTGGKILIAGNKKAAVEAYIAAGKIVTDTATRELYVYHDTIVDKTLVMGRKLEAGATAVWNPALNPFSDDTSAVWSDWMNWEDHHVPLTNKARMRRSPAIFCNVEIDSAKAFTLRVGSGGPGKFRMKSGSSLTLGNEWIGLGDDDDATVIIEAGAVLTTESHIWMARKAGVEANIDIYGSIIGIENVGLDRKSLGAVGNVTIHEGGLLQARYSHNENFGPGAHMDLRGGVLKFTQAQEMEHLELWTSEGKITAYGGEGDVVLELVDGEAIAIGLHKAEETTVWNPAGNPSSTGLWSERDNWSDGRVPDSNKVVFNVPEAMECLLDVESYTRYFVLGDNGPGGTLRVGDGGVLSTGAHWAGVGWTDTATMVVDSGGVVNFGQHMWVGWEPNSLGTVILDGGTIHVANMFGIDFEGKGGKGAVHVNSGNLILSELHGTNSIRDGSMIDIKEGIVSITGDQLSKVNDYIAAGKITAYDGTGYVGVKFENDTTWVTGSTEPISVEEEGVTAELGFYPNPASDYIYLKGNVVADIYIYSVTGSLVLTEKNASSVNVGDLDSGNYYVKVISNDAISVGGLIIQ